MKSNLSRRQLIRRLGVSAAAAPLVPLLDRTAEAASLPRRLLLVYSPNGALPSYFWPTGGETDFTFKAGSFLEALNPLRSALIVPMNVKRTFDGLGGDHERGIGCLWTGARLSPGNQFGGGGYPSGASIDQILGKILPVETDFRTLEVAVQNNGPGASGDTMLHMCYAAGDQPVAPESSPYRLFDRLVGGGGGAISSAQLARVRVERQSVIDLVRAELNVLRNQIDRGDRLKLEGHLEGIRGIESRLQMPTTSAAACPTKPNGQIDVSANDSVPTVVKLQSDLVVSALACDRARIATLQWSRAFSMIRHNWAGVSEEHHPVSHDGSSGGIQNLVNINRWYATQFAYLLGELKKVPEGNGTLLDNTLVVWANELSEAGSHDPNPASVILAGSLGGRLRTGRFLNYNQQYDWNQMLVTICQAMGANIDKVGDLGRSGTIPGLLV